MERAERQQRAEEASLRLERERERAQTESRRAWVERTDEQTETNQPGSTEMRGSLAFSAPTDARVLPLPAPPQLPAHMRAKSEVAVPGSVTPDAAALRASERSCTTCGGRFPDVVDFRLHFKSEWHRYNLSLKLKGLSPLSEEEFHRQASAGNLEIL